MILYYKYLLSRLKFKISLDFKELNSFFDAIKNLNDNKEFKTELLFMGIGLNDSDITEQYKNAGDMLDTININDLK